MDIFCPLHKSVKEGFAHKCKRIVFFIVVALMMVTATSCDSANYIFDTSPSTPITATASAALQATEASSQEMPTLEALSSTASANISKITVTFYGDPCTAKGFTWYTNHDSLSSDVQVIKKTRQTPDFNRAMIFTGTTGNSHNSPEEFVHKAFATGLTSDTAYYYRVGDAKLNIWSSPAVFTTAPENGPFTFIDLSDTQFADQAGAKVTADTISKALSQVENAKFIVHNGDVVDNKSEKQWNLLLQTAKSSLMNTTIMPASGNHDAGSSTFIDHFNLDIPRSATTTGAYYSVDYCNTHFVVLNTNESSDSYKEFTNAQVDWLKADIGFAKSAGAQWVIVIIHMGPYSTAEHSSDSNVKDTRAKIAPLFNELGVDLVLQGHDHVYERSKPIVNGISAKQSTVTENFNGQSVRYIVDPEGPIYLTPGTAGTKHYYQSANPSQAYLSLFDVANGPYKGDPDINNQETFISITVDENNLTVTAYQISKTINGGIPYVIDQFGVTQKSQHN